MTEVQKTTYTLYTCDIYNKKQTEELSSFTLQDYGKAKSIICSIWDIHICDPCTVEIYKTVCVIKRVKR